MLSLLRHSGHDDPAARPQDPFALRQYTWNLRCVKEFECEAHEDSIEGIRGVRQVLGVAAIESDAIRQVLPLQKLPRLRQARELLSKGGRWDKLRRRLGEIVRPPELIADCLRRAGGACRAEDLGMDRRRLLDAFGHASQARARVTILDLAALMGIMPSAAREIIDQWA